MSQQLIQTASLKQLFSSENVKGRFEAMLGKKSAGFISSVLQVCNSNGYLSDADPMSVLNSAATAASLDLPINPSLGFAYIVPFNTKQKDGSYKKMAQLQIGYKGLIQLAQRSGQFKTINVTDIKDGELKSIDRVTGQFQFEWLTEGRPNAKTIGYAAYFELINGFSKVLYMSKEDCTAHGTKYSKTFTQKYGLWAKEFDLMSMKTTLKMLLSKYAPLSIEMQTAQLADQSIQLTEGDYQYPDNDTPTIDITEQNERVEKERLVSVIAKAKNVKALMAIESELVQEGKDKQEYLELIEDAKAKFIDKELSNS